MKAGSSLLVTVVLSFGLSGVTHLSGFPPGAGATQSRPAGSSTETAYRAAADSADTKFHRIEQNASRPKPDQTPTVFSERELNAYVADGRVELPKGVNRVQFTGAQGSVTTDASIDFDKVTAGSRRSANPLMSLFSGVHEVQVVSHGQGSGGEARVHVDSVSIDGVAVPRMALEYFVDHYIRPRYPDLGLDSRFQLPARIDTATVGDHELTVTQK
jgi:hypothetical protein